MSAGGGGANHGPGHPGAGSGTGMPQHVAALAAGAAGMIHPHHFALIETAFSNAAGLRQLAGLHHQGQQQQQLQDHHGHSISSQGGLQDTSPTIQSPPLQQQHQVT